MDKVKGHCFHSDLFEFLVGARGFEPPTPTSRT